MRLRDGSRVLAAMAAPSTPPRRLRQLRLALRVGLLVVVMLRFHAAWMAQTDRSMVAMVVVAECLLTIYIALALMWTGLQRYWPLELVTDWAAVCWFVSVSGNPSTDLVYFFVLPLLTGVERLRPALFSLWVVDVAASHVLCVATLVRRMPGSWPYSFVELFAPDVAIRVGLVVFVASALRLLHAAGTRSHPSSSARPAEALAANGRGHPMRDDVPRVYIAYKWQDDARNMWVERFYRDLREQHGVDAQLDRYEVDYGESFSDYMTSRIDRECEALLLIITPAAVEAIDQTRSGGVHFEMQLANARRLREPGFRVIGIYREGNETTAYVRDHRWIDFRDDAQYAERLKELADSLWGRRTKPQLASVEMGMPAPEPPEDAAGRRFLLEVAVLARNVIVEWATHEYRRVDPGLTELQHALDSMGNDAKRLARSSLAASPPELREALDQLAGPLRSAGQHHFYMGRESWQQWMEFGAAAAAAAQRVLDIAVPHIHFSEAERTAVLDAVRETCYRVVDSWSEHEERTYGELLEGLRSDLAEAGRALGRLSGPLQWASERQLADKMDEIAMRLRRMEYQQFYADGGHSWNVFVEDGNAAAVAAQEVLTGLAQ